MKYISYKEVINIIVICGECGERSEGWLKNTSANSMLLLKKISFFPHTIFAKSCYSSSTSYSYSFFIVV